jgi:hypothetical protein
VILTAAALTGGCTWVKLTDAGANVRLMGAADVSHCERVGAVAATTQDRVLLARHPDKVTEELIVLASNQAAAIGGNAIVPEGPAQDGTQAFRVYRCR